MPALLKFYRTNIIFIFHFFFFEISNIDHKCFSQNIAQNKNIFNNRIFIKNHMNNFLAVFTLDFDVPVLKPGSDSDRHFYNR